MTKQYSRITRRWTAFVGIVAYLLVMVANPGDGFSYRIVRHQYSWLSTQSIDLERFSVNSRESRIFMTMEEESSTSRRLLLRGSLPAAALFASTLVANPLLAHAGIDVSGLRVEGTPRLSSPPPPVPSGQNGKTIELAGVQYTPAAMILQMAEQTASMEGMMKASASDVQGNKSRKDRVEDGSKGLGPGVVARTDLTRSVAIMVKNSQIATIAPKAAITLQGIPDYLANKNPNQDMTFDEYLTVAKKYEQAREDLRIAFESISEDDQQVGMQIVRAIRKRDMERMAAMQQQ